MLLYIAKWCNAYSLFYFDLHFIKIAIRKAHLLCRNEWFAQDSLAILCYFHRPFSIAACNLYVGANFHQSADPNKTDCSWCESAKTWFRKCDVYRCTFPRLIVWELCYFSTWVKTSFNRKMFFFRICWAELSSSTVHSIISSQKK